jgi:hypothetical protein
MKLDFKETVNVLVVEATADDSEIVRTSNLGGSGFMSPNISPFTLRCKGVMLS